MSSMTDPGRGSRRWWQLGVLALVLGTLTACALPAAPGAPGPTSEPSAANPPATGEVPPLLEPQDLGPDWRVSAEVLRGDLGLGIVGNMCWEMYKDPSVSHEAGLRTRVLTNAPANVAGSEDDGYQDVLIEVRRFEAGWGAKHLAEWAAHMDKNCKLGDYTYQITTLETGFAGDQSMLVLLTYGTTSKYLAVTRKGDLVVLIDAIPERNLVRKAAIAATARAR